jgi:hypothetical protein
VVLATLVLVCLRVSTWGRRRRLRDDNEAKLANAGKHFMADMDLIARQK